MKSAMHCCLHHATLAALSLVWVLPISVAEEPVRAWLTVIDDGDRKDAVLGPWDDNLHYDLKQDEDYRLLRGINLHQLNGTGEPTSACWLVTIDELHPQQRLEGIGAAMTDSAAYVLNQLRQKNRSLYDYTMLRLFSSRDGAGFSYLRCPIGSSDYTATDHSYTAADLPSEDLSTFTIEHDLRYVIPMLKESRRIQPQLKLMGTPWSAPAWMKTNGKLEGITPDEKKEGKTNRLRPDKISLYAQYLVKYCLAYRDAGVPLDALTMQNEPQLDVASYPCMRMTEADQRLLLRELGPALREVGLETKIYLHDHNWIVHPDDATGIGGDHKEDPVQLVTRILLDPELRPFLAGTAWHTYAGNREEMQRVYQTMRDRFPDLQVMATEATGWGRQRGTWWGDVQWGLEHHWLSGLNAGSATALQWNLALDHQFGPTLRDDSAAMGLVTINTDSWQDVKWEREFYAMAHVSLVAQPGSVRLPCQVVADNEETTAETPILALATRRGKRLGLVLVNRSSAAQQVRARIGASDQSLALPPHSLVTVVAGEADQASVAD